MQEEEDFEPGIYDIIDPENNKFDIDVVIEYLKTLKTKAIGTNLKA